MYGASEQTRGRTEGQRNLLGGKYPWRARSARPGRRSSRPAPRGQPLLSPFPWPRFLLRGGTGSRCGARGAARYRGGPCGRDQRRGLRERTRRSRPPTNRAAAPRTRPCRVLCRCFVPSTVGLLRPPETPNLALTTLGFDHSCPETSIFFQNQILPVKTYW